MTEKIVKKRAGNMASIVYERLRADILNGSLPPGKPLSQLAIASASGTSRGPVREALRRLQQDQLVIAYPNQRFNVAPFDVSDLEGILCLHLLNVTFAVRVSVPSLTDAEVQHLSSCVKRMDASSHSDDVKWDAALRDFTLTLTRHAGPRITSFIDNLIDNIQRHRKSTLGHLPRVHSGGPEFGDIVRAASARDGKQAAIRYASLFSRVAMLILAGLAPQYNASRLRGYVSGLISVEKS